MAKTGEPTKPHSGYLTLKALLEAEDGGPAHTGTTLVPAAPKVQQVVRQANKAGIRVVETSSDFRRSVGPPVKRSVSSPLIRARGTRRLGCGRPARRRTSRATRAGPSSDPDQPEPPHRRHLSLSHRREEPRSPGARSRSAVPTTRAVGAARERKETMTASLNKVTGCLSPTCSRCGSALAGRGKVHHAKGIVTWVWACPCGRKRRVRFAEGRR
jgi:hypothetical protein